MIHRSAWLVLALLAGPALAQENRSIAALGTFDQIAVECARHGSDAEVDVYRLRLWHAYLADNESDQEIKDRVAALRAQIIDDVSDELRRQYKAARAAIPDVGGLADAQQGEFHRLCEAPKLNGLPDRR